MYVQVKNIMELNEEKLKISSKKFRVNEVCAFLSITPRILKHYENTGVLTPVRTDGNDYREYSAEDVIKIQLAERLKNMQLSQREIGEYFSGELDIEKKYDELVRLREMIDALIDIFEVDLKNGAPQYSIEPEQSLLCFCKAYPVKPIQYFEARDAYTSAIVAGCVCDVAHTFFYRYDELSMIPSGADFDAQYFKDKTYRVCVPIVSPPKTKQFDGTVEVVTRKKSLTRKCSPLGLPTHGSGVYLQEEAARRGLTLTGKSWMISETGPHKKTAKRSYTTIIGAEIE